MASEAEEVGVRTCKICGGLLNLMGGLGRRLHYRCQGCGLGWSYEIEAKCGRGIETG